MKRCFLILTILFPLLLTGQQNHLFYQMQYVAESNFLNPAVQAPCPWFIGLPVISSFHLNYANSAFSFNDLVNITDQATAELQIDEVVSHMGLRTFIGAELHTTILALGHKRKDYYFNFSLIEKVNLPLTLSREVFRLPWGGNTQFLDESAGTKGSSSYAIHYREYALGVSKKFDYNSFWGIKGKLLFGKFYLGLPESDLHLFTDSTDYALTLDGYLLANISGPVVLNATNGNVNSIGITAIPGYTIYQYLFNRNNWGIAVDAGFIRQISGRTSISGSIIDLGFISWRSNTSNLSFEENYTYRGILIDSVNVIGALIDSIDITISNDHFYTMLPLKFYLGANYLVSEKLTAGILGSGVIYRTKLLTALTLSLDYNPFRNLHIIGSYSLMYRSWNNLGMGFSIGRGPMQFYAVSDNVAGMIWPLSARNLNLRFGLNINLGCSKKENEHESASSPGYYTCPAYSSPIERARRRR